MILLLLIIQVLLTASLSQAQDLTVDTVLHRHFKAVGGQERWQQIKTCYAEQSYWEIPIYMPPHRRFLGDQLPKNNERYYQYPDQYRINIYQEGEPGAAYIFQPKESKFYSYRSNHEEVLPEPEHTIAVISLTFSTYLLGPTPLLLSAYGDSVLMYQGKMEAYGKLCHKLVITDRLPLGGRAFVYIDAETYRVHALVHEKAIDKYKIYDNYQKVEGLLIPHRICSYHEGERYEEYTIDKIEINQLIDPILFTVW